MTGGKMHWLERGATHLLLLAGSLAFAFPFFWMLMTSLKLPAEMDTNRLRLLPSTPRPQAASPYMDRDQFVVTGKPPDDVADAVWQEARPRLLALLGRRLAAWTPRLPNAQSGESPHLPDPEAYRAVMTEGLLQTVQQCLSDKVRRQPLEQARQQWRATHEAEQALPRDETLLAQLPPPAIDAAAAAIATEAEALLTDAVLAQTFESAYRRVCLGEVRLRTRDNHDLVPAPPSAWRVDQGQVELAPRHEGTRGFQEARMTFTAAAPAAVFSFAPPVAGLDLRQVERLFVRYRSDGAWARARIEVTCQGQLYRTTEAINFVENGWIEQELRWPEHRQDPLERRVYRTLQHVGPAPAGSPPLLVRLSVTRNTAWGAWRDKLLNNYIRVFREVPYARYIMTSFSLVILNIGLSIFSCTLVGYAFGRLEWPGRGLCFAILLATMMLPGQVTMIPTFLIAKGLGWFNTLLPLWVPAAFGTPFFIFLFRQFFKNIPADLEDAARIDGCGFLRIYWHVMLPLVKPTIATVAIFTFMGTWNNFMGPLIYLNDDYSYPLALGLFKFNLRNGADIGLMMAGALVMTMPIILLFFFVQRYFIQGISLSGTKA